MDSVLLPSLNILPTRLSFIEKTLNMSEKLLLSKLNCENSNEQSDMLEFLHNNNSTIHSSNRKIIQCRHSLINEPLYDEDVFDKALDSYIMQYGLFPFIKTNQKNKDSKDRKESKDSSKDRKEYYPKSNKIKIHRANKIDLYLERLKRYYKLRKHQRGLSCIACFGQRMDLNKQPYFSSGKDNNNNQMIHKKEMLPNQNDLTNNLPIQLRNTDNVPHKIIISEVNDIMTLNDNMPHNNNQNNNIGVFPYSTKAVTFILTNDIIKPISIISKSSNYEYILHSYTYLFDKNAFVNDLYFYELKLRSNIEKALLSKSIKYPIVLYGNVFLPQVVFFRGGEEVNFKLLDTPIISPMIIAQLVPDTFVTREKDIQGINNKIIEEAFTLSEELDYETILVNILPFAEIRPTFSIIKSYIETLNNKSYNINSVNFMLNMTTNQFQSQVNNTDIPQLLQKVNIKSTILSL